MVALYSFLTVRPLTDVAVVMEISRRLALSCLIFLVGEVDVGLIFFVFDTIQ